jgi:hypothetical protein
MPLLLGEPDLHDLEIICDALNSKSERGVELLRLITIWRQSGPNLQEMTYADQALWKKLQDSVRPVYLPTKTGRAHLALFPTGDPEDEKNRALVMFVRLTLSRNWDKLGGPCARCCCYYIKKRVSQKMYCSRTCNKTATSKVSMKKKRAKEHRNRIELAAQALLKYRELKITAPPLGKWAERKYRGRLTPTFITRNMKAIEKHARKLAKGAK